MTNIVLFGKPGAGKGTQADFLKIKYNLFHISTGDLFRFNITNKTSLGNLAKTYMDNGDLVPDEVTIEMLKECVESNFKSEGFIFDGFPRNLKQAQKLDEIMSDMNMHLDFVFHIDVDEKILTSRIENRAKQEKIIRKDDTSAVLIERLKVYNRDTKPVLDHYFNQNILNVIDGMGTIDEVSSNISKLINKDFKVD